MHTRRAGGRLETEIKGIEKIHPIYPEIFCADRKIVSIRIFLRHCFSWKIYLFFSSGFSHPFSTVGPTNPSLA